MTTTHLLPARPMALAAAAASGIEPPRRGRLAALEAHLGRGSGATPACGRGLDHPPIPWSVPRIPARLCRP